MSTATRVGGLMAAALLLGSQRAQANFSGIVFCDVNCNGMYSAGDGRIPGVTINVYSCTSGLLVATTNTDANGFFEFSGFVVPPFNFYYLCLGSIPAGMTVSPQFPAVPGLTNNTANAGGCTPCFDFNIAGDNWDNNFGLCGAACSPPPCTNCVNPALGLGVAAGISVLELGAAQVSITGPPGGIIGDVSIAPHGQLQMSGTEYITGTIRLGAGATFQNSSTGGIGPVLQNVDLSAPIAAAYAAYHHDTNLPCTQTFALLDGKTVTTIAGLAGLNVICVKDISMQGTQIKLTGPANATFVFNITGKFVLNGGGAGPQIRVDTSTGLLPSSVLYNVVGAGEDVAFNGGGGGLNCCAAIVDGTILAPYRKIALSPGLVNGEVISAQDISIVSGSSVRCPPCPQAANGFDRIKESLTPTSD